MQKHATVLDPQPADPTPDRGPWHRGGAFAVFVTIAGGLTLLGAAVIIYREGSSGWLVAGMALLAIITARAGWCVLERWIHRAELPRSHAVLSGSLGFEIRFTCRDVAAAVFFDPDRLHPGSRARLLCCVENHAARRRIARFRIGPHQGLGLAEPLDVALALAPGQAAVHALPLTVAAGMNDGEHDLPVTLRVEKPSGTGARLPGARRHFHDVWTARFAAPFTISRGETREDSPLVPGSEQAHTITIASVSEPAPRLGALEELLAGGSSGSKRETQP